MHSMTRNEKLNRGVPIPFTVPKVEDLTPLQEVLFTGQGDRPASEPYSKGESRSLFVVSGVQI